MLASSVTLERGKRIDEVFKQIQYNPVPVESQIATLYAIQNGQFDDVAVDKIKDFQDKMSSYLRDRKSDLLAKIAKEKKLNEEIEAELKSAVSDFKQTYK